MFEKTAEFYDAIYSFKDYEEEARRLNDIIQTHKRAPGVHLLDIACGTGGHIAFLKADYEVEGLDLDAGMLEIAHQRHPEVNFHQGDMVSFDLGRDFEVVICLFSSIGYVRTLPKLQQAIGNMAGHVRPGGLLVIEPWFTPEDFLPGSVHATFVDQPDLKIARMNISEVDEGMSILDMHYLIATVDGIKHVVERHELGLFEHDDYLTALDQAGLETVYDLEGLTGRGLYLGIRPDG
jgi:ubiquinone/menaquinone biosynthesis C-methylase UbiE